jgi:hypothetical protein
MRSIIYVTILFFSLGTFAQKPILKKQKLNFTPEQRAELQSKRLALVLDLNDKQLKQVESVQLERAKQLELKQKAGKQDKTSGKKLSPDEIFAIKNQNLDEQIAFQKQMKEILTVDQYQRWKEARKNHFDKRQKHRALKKTQTDKTMRVPQ